MKLITEFLAMMAACAPMAAGQSVIALLDGTGSTVTPLWQDNEASAGSVAVAGGCVVTLDDGMMRSYDISSGSQIQSIATGVGRVGSSADGHLWGCITDGDVINVGTVGADGRLERPMSVSPRALQPEAYLGVKESEFGPVSVSGDIADGSATVAFVEKVIAADEAETESLRLWRAYGCFGDGELEVRYSDLCLIDQYPYVTIFPDINTQVTLTSLTASLTDNAGDVPYYYTSRSGTQQVKQRLTAPVSPDPGLTGIHVMQCGGYSWLLYASAPCEVTLVRMDDLDRGLDPDNLHYATTLPLPYADMSVAPQSVVHIASAPDGAGRVIAMYSAGKALVAYRLTGGNGGVGDIAADEYDAYVLDQSTLRAKVDVVVYDICGRKVMSIRAGEASALPRGTYVVEGGGAARIVALR